MAILVKAFDVLQFVDVKISTGQFWVICSEFVEVLAICLETGATRKICCGEKKTSLSYHLPWKDISFFL